MCDCKLDQEVVEVNPAAAVYGVLAWLTTRPSKLSLGASCDCAVVAELAGKFCKANNFDAPNDMNLVVHPEE